MSKNETRWEQRFNNFGKALNKLAQSVYFVENKQFDENLAEDGNGRGVLNDLIKQGLIQSFEYTHELAWNVMKDFAVYQGNNEVSGSRDAVREAFAMGLIRNGDVWMEMIRSRNKTSHTYNEETADDIYLKILKEYYPAFIAFRDKMEEIRNAQQGDLFDPQ